MKSITLEHPLKRGESTLNEIRFLEPKGTGWLKGIKLFDLMQMDTTALTIVLPRITDPALTEQEIRALLHPADLVQLGAEVAGFLAPKSLTAADTPPE
ncbi:MAG: phage tail assembly protein [Betaproteobacteria bacterium]|nr:phage tail assembly protein [Betaproteobacteria bacterium]